jgi:hypothetical protein
MAEAEVGGGETRFVKSLVGRSKAVTFDILSKHKVVAVPNFGDQTVDVFAVANAMCPVHDERSTTLTRKRASEAGIFYFFFGEGGGMAEPLSSIETHVPTIS